MWSYDLTWWRWAAEKAWHVWIDRFIVAAGRAHDELGVNIYFKFQTSAYVQPFIIILPFVTQTNNNKYSTHFYFHTIDIVLYDMC